MGAITASQLKQHNAVRISITVRQRLELVNRELSHTPPALMEVVEGCGEREREEDAEIPCFCP